MADTAKTTVYLKGHMTITQTPVACEKDIWSPLILFTQPIRKSPFFGGPWVLLLKLITTQPNTSSNDQNHAIKLTFFQEASLYISFENNSS